jgi:hypothetical protein
MGVLELRVIECGHTSLDYELALSGHPGRLATASEPTRTVEVLRHRIYAYPPG